MVPQRVPRAGSTGEGESSHGCLFLGKCHPASAAAGDGQCLCLEGILWWLVGTVHYQDDFPVSAFVLVPLWVLTVVLAYMESFL